MMDKKKDQQFYCAISILKLCGTSVCIDRDGAVVVRCLKRLSILHVFFIMSYNWEIFSKVSILSEILKCSV